MKNHKIRPTYLAGFLLFACTLLLTSCATAPLTTAKKETKETTQETAAKDPVGEQDKKDNVTAIPKTLPPASANLSEKTAQDIENLTIDEVIRIEEPNTANLYDNSRYDFPITVNARVEGWIDYFTGRGRPHMERYLARSSRYMPVMKEILKKNGLPEDLVYLALIESGFNLTAKSRARAVGAWQFMKATGKRYGLRVDAWIDERRDPLRSTEAAAKYLKDLYLMFESWYLAASAYNAGEYKILRAIESEKTHNFWRICQTSAIRRETKDYVPKLIAAAIIGKNPAKYGFEDVVYEEPLEFERVTVNFPVHLGEVATLIDASDEELKELNPHLPRGIVPPDVESFEIRVPVGRRVVLERALASMRARGTSLAALPLQHTVKAGETLRSVANKYKIRVNDLASINNLSPKERVPPGSALIIPNRTAKTVVADNRPQKTSAKRAVGSQPSASANGEYIIHTVKRGESLWSISEKYDVTVQQIFRWNNLNRSRINPGRKLKIKASAVSQSESSASDVAVRSKTNS